MLLVGIGGSGRQSLARLASSICEYATFQIEVSKHYRRQEFREGRRERSPGDRGAERWKPVASRRRLGAGSHLSEGGTRDGMVSLKSVCPPSLLPSSGPDIKRLYRQAGVELKPTSFLFVDTQIADESFLEDINNILSSGEVPNLYKTDEFEEVRTLPYPPPA